MPSASTPSDPSREPEGSREEEIRPRESLGVNIFAYLLSGVVVFGALGWWLDQWLGTSFIVGFGILGGMALSLYIVWVRYGSPR